MIAWKYPAVKKYRYLSRNQILVGDVPDLAGDEMAIDSGHGFVCLEASF
jgi:hypothetical protein